MRVLVACEESGTVRDAFARRGHEVMSCDFEQSRSPGLPHFRGDVREVLSYPWDLMIAHPPCQHLSVSGARYHEEKKLAGLQQAAASFFIYLAKADIPRIALENPISVISSIWREPHQIIQPFQFGHDASKSTCLWLKNLPRLRPTQFVEPRSVGDLMRWANQTDSGQNRLSPSDTRARDRSATFVGIAEAMAEQWGDTETYQGRLAV